MEKLDKITELDSIDNLFIKLFVKTRRWVNNIIKDYSSYFHYKFSIILFISVYALRTYWYICYQKTVRLIKVPIFLFRQLSYLKQSLVDWFLILN